MLMIEEKTMQMMNAGGDVRGKIDSSSRHTQDVDRPGHREAGESENFIRTVK